MGAGTLLVFVRMTGLLIRMRGVSWLGRRGGGVAGKFAVLKDKEALVGWLRPNQVAVGVKAGAEVMVHALRQWWERNSDNQRWVLLKNGLFECFQ